MTNNTLPLKGQPGAARVSRSRKHPSSRPVPGFHIPDAVLIAGVVLAACTATFFFHSAYLKSKPANPSSVISSTETAAQLRELSERVKTQEGHVKALAESLEQIPIISPSLASEPQTSGAVPRALPPVPFRWRKPEQAANSPAPRGNPRGQAAAGTQMQGPQPMDLGGGGLSNRSPMVPSQQVTIVDPATGQLKTALIEPTTSGRK